MNQIIISGRITKDHELRKTNTGKDVLPFTLAVYRNKDVVDFLDCVAYENAALTLYKHTEKGGRVVVGGTLQTRSYEDKNGQKRKVYEIVVGTYDIIDFKKEEKAEFKEHPKTQALLKKAEKTTFEVEDDNLPF